jgi:hypothetical protein
VLNGRKKERDQEKLWYRIKTTDGNYRYDIDSIMNEQVDFYSKSFQSEGWDENSAHELTIILLLMLINWTITKKKHLTKTLT